MIINTMSIISQKGGEVDQSFFLSRRECGLQIQDKSAAQLLGQIKFHPGRYIITGIYRNSTNRSSSFVISMLPPYLCTIS